MKRTSVVRFVGAFAVALSAVVFAEDSATRPRPKPAEVYVLPDGTQFTEMEAKYARACVAYVEARLNQSPSQKAWSDAMATRRDFAMSAPGTLGIGPAAAHPPLPDTPPPLAEDTPGKSETPPPAAAPNASPAAPRETAPSTDPAPVPPPAPAVLTGGALTLTAGKEFAALASPAPVAGKELLPVASTRTEGVSIVWGESRETLNLFDSHAANAPMHIEASLNGGPWLAARYGEIRVPDLGPGRYQIRIVAWPSRGNSYVLDPIVLERTKSGWTRR